MKRRWIVKAGSKMVCAGGPLLMRAWMQQVAELRRRHIEVIWVTSGAIAWAAQEMRFPTAKKRSLPEQQALSAIGQPLIMDQYNLALRATHLLGAQVLLTAGDMKDPRRRRNLQNTLKELLRLKVIPILNENDAVATEEIHFGDNDSLASQVGVMMKAERLVLMTDVDGFFDGDPHASKKTAALIAHRDRITASDFKKVRRSVSKVGTGGMFSKLTSAEKARRAGLTVHLVRGDWPHNLLEIAKGHAIGTQIGGQVGKK